MFATVKCVLTAESRNLTKSRNQMRRDAELRITHYGCLTKH